MSNDDIYSSKPKIELPLTRIGLTKVTVPLHVTEADLRHDLTCEIDLFTDLPSDRTGGDFSRHIKSVESLFWSEGFPSNLEDISSTIVRTLAGTLEYPKTIEVSLKAKLLTSDPKSGILYSDTLIERTTLMKNNSEKTMVGVEVQGITACPCTMQKMRGQLTTSNPEFEEVLSKIPIITHNQRNLTTVLIELRNSRTGVVKSLLDLIREVIGTVPESGPGGTDLELIYGSHSNPLLVEDVVREVARKVKTTLADFHPDSEIVISSRSEESIRHHDAFAEFSGKFSELV